MGNRDIIFISHATPEDNDFTIWLASRLQLLGYEVWIDKNALLGGEKFWEEIDQVIRYKAVKVLLIYSRNICQKDENDNIKLGKLKDGIYKEYSLAESISKENKFDDFIILLNIDGATYNLFIGADRLNQISFHDNWAIGLQQLLKKLEKENIPKNKTESISELTNWFNQSYLSQNIIHQKTEYYYNNVWPIYNLPDRFYIFQFKSEEKAKLVYEQDYKYPICRISNNLSSFENYQEFSIIESEELVIIKPEVVYIIKISEVMLGYDNDTFPKHSDSENYLKQLLKMTFHQMMKNRGLYWYELANKRFAYFFTPGNLTKFKVKFKYSQRLNRKPQWKNLIGKYSKFGFWHFAVSEKPVLKPIIGFSLKNHMVFTNDGFNFWRDKRGEIDKAKIHSHRRKKCKRFYNAEWRDLFIAFLHGLQKDDKIEIPLSSSIILKFDSFPLIYKAKFGYLDPKDKKRQGLLSEDVYFENEELEEEDG